MRVQVAPPLEWNKPYRELTVTIKDNGNLATDEAAADGLIRQALKKAGFQRVVPDRGLQSGDTAIIDLEVKVQGGKMPLPGLSQSKVVFDTEADPLDLTSGEAPTGVLQHQRACA